MTGPKGRMNAPPILEVDGEAEGVSPRIRRANPDERYKCEDERALFFGVGVRAPVP